MESLFKFLSQEAREFQYGASVPEIDANDVSSLLFHRSFVSRNQPVLIRGACQHWAAFQKWDTGYMCNKYGDKEVVVAVTPNGYADAVAFDTETHQEYFVMPEERKMKFSDFWKALEHPDKYSGVYYLQRQNSNLTEEFPELLEDIERHIPWATEAFGTDPDAVNFWAGDSRAVTSMHKDPYENIYCVLSGHKDFTLHPPTDRPWIPYKKYPTATYLECAPGQFVIKPNSSNNVKSSMQCDLKDEENSIPWICIDPISPDLEKYPTYQNSSPFQVRVSAGDALYLPSLWYHHVRQSHGCMAVNYWYDMQYDIKYVYHRFLESLVESKECKKML